MLCKRNIDQADIVPSIKSDHSAILLPFNGIEEQIRGPSFWKFNASSLDDKDDVTLINSKYEVWVEEFKDIDDPRCFGILLSIKLDKVQFLIANVKQGKERPKWKSLEKKLEKRSGTMRSGLVTRKSDLSLIIIITPF